MLVTAPIAMASSLPEKLGFGSNLIQSGLTSSQVKNEAYGHSEIAL
ncbi:hypothetical protein SBA1_500034 [Candidatus Sulfotelmatobacter kueseliae]|uniref:Uncharacterized protein n=1 Tax=Candidatus Sulfotelmatobacter kueseliae TaxID=2042962 RepID=A0A2U3KW78_9BACT|nr:hypothetical protein SBA1_500034 [Candidatus Sulfotelmatobacter kueseliae]